MNGGVGVVAVLGRREAVAVLIRAAAVVAAAASVRTVTAGGKQEQRDQTHGTSKRDPAQDTARFYGCRGKTGSGAPFART